MWSTDHLGIFDFCCKVLKSTFNILPESGLKYLCPTIFTWWFFCFIKKFHVSEWNVRNDYICYLFKYQLALIFEKVLEIGILKHSKIHQLIRMMANLSIIISKCFKKLSKVRLEWWTRTMLFLYYLRKIFNCIAKIVQVSKLFRIGVCNS